MKGSVERGPLLWSRRDRYNRHRGFRDSLVPIVKVHDDQDAVVHPREARHDALLTGSRITVWTDEPHTVTPNHVVPTLRRSRYALARSKLRSSR